MKSVIQGLWKFTGYSCGEVQASLEEMMMETDDDETDDENDEVKSEDESEDENNVVYKYLIYSCTFI